MHSDGDTERGEIGIPVPSTSLRKVHSYQFRIFYLFIYFFFFFVVVVVAVYSSIYTTTSEDEEARQSYAVEILCLNV